MSCIAIKKALSSHLPDLEFEYVFCCEKEPKKRVFIDALHKLLAHELTAPGAVDPEIEMCIFEDILQPRHGKGKCSVHSHTAGKRFGQ